MADNLCGAMPGLVRCSELLNSPARLYLIMPLRQVLVKNKKSKGLFVLLNLSLIS